MVVMNRTTRDLTDAQILRRDMHDQAERVARDLESLAERIRSTAKQFDKEDRPAAGVVADIVNDYTQGGNAIGCMFWSMINELSRML